MIKYPISEEINYDYNEDVIKFFPVMKCTSIKQFIKAGDVTVGSKFIIEGRDITCIHHKDNQWFFQYDDCPITSTAKPGALEESLKRIWNDIIPKCLKEEIEYIFIPTKIQIFGGKELKTNTYQFDYYKDNAAHRVKNRRGEIDGHWTNGNSCYWWLSTIVEAHSSTGCHNIVDTCGHPDWSYDQYYQGVPVCFLIEIDD